MRSRLLESNIYSKHKWAGGCHARQDFRWWRFQFSTERVLSKHTLFAHTYITQMAVGRYFNRGKSVASHTAIRTVENVPL